MLWLVGNPFNGFVEDSEDEKKEVSVERDFWNPRVRRRKETAYVEGKQEER
jgi:hypothetical protein